MTPALSFDPIAADGLCFALRSALEAETHIAAEMNGTHRSIAYHAALSRIYDEHLKRKRVHYQDGETMHSHLFWQRRLQTFKLLNDMSA